MRRRKAPPNAGKQWVMRSLRESHSSTRFTFTGGLILDELRCINFDVTRIGGGSFLAFVSIRLLRALGRIGGLRRLMWGRRVLPRQPDRGCRLRGGPSGRGAWGLLTARARGWLGIRGSARRRLVR